MNNERQHFCGECGATPNTKYCIKAPGDKRIEWHENMGTIVDESIEFCPIRLMKLSERQSRENERTT